MKWLLSYPGSEESRARYMAWIARIGAEGETVKAGDPVPAPAGFSALLLTGGGDVDPASYGEAAAPQTAGVNAARDSLEAELIGRFLAARKPVFGICRGYQELNVYFGGKLIQHVPAWLAAQPRTNAPEEHARLNNCDSRHAIEWAAGAPPELRVIVEANSAHHQAIEPTAPGRNISILAWSPAGVPEAISGSGLPAPVLAVQWHPERLPAEHAGSQAILQRCLALQAGCA